MAKTKPHLIANLVERSSSQVRADSLANGINWKSSLANTDAGAGAGSLQLKIKLEDGWLAVKMTGTSLRFTEQTSYTPVARPFQREDVFRK